MECKVVTVVPSAEDLSSVQTRLECSQPECKSIFQCSSNLRMHLEKHHKISNNFLTRCDVGVMYACPIQTCKYNVKSNKHFAKMKYVKQHYLKCHAKKMFHCQKCKKSFSTETMVKNHSKICGKMFICSCGWKYNTKDTLMTHCKRKKHRPAEIEKAIVDKTISATTEKTESMVKNHSKICGKKFICSCGWKCNTKRTLLTHCKRKKHCPADSEKAVEDETTSVTSEKTENNEENTVVKVCFASPPHSRSPRKPTSDVTVFPTHYIAAIALSELSTTFIIPKNCHIGVQTTDTKVNKKRSPNEKKRKSSQETQTSEFTGDSKKQKICAETQTRTHVKRKLEVKPTARHRKKSIETQTKDPMPFLPSFKNESLDDAIFNESSLSNSSINNEPSRKSALPTSLDDDTVWGGQNFSKSSQESKPFITTINSDMFSLTNELNIRPRGNDPSLSNFTNFDINKLCNIETQTELDSILHSEGEGTSTIETQTTDDHLIDDLIYSNTCTQTCDDVSDLFDFNLVDIETQTAWPVL